MVVAQSAIELPLAEQIRMPIDKAGEKYNGHFIFFTNAERQVENGRWKEYGIPRSIALNNKAFCESGLSKKYDDRALYGIQYYCTIYMEEDQIPPVLTF